MKMYAYIRTNLVESFLEGDYTFSIGITTDTPEEMAEYCDNIPAGEIEINIDVNPVDVRQSAITNLEAEADKIRAEMSAKLQRVETRKQQLLALEHTND